MRERIIVETSITVGIRASFTYALDYRTNAINFGKAGQGKTYTTKNIVEQSDGEGIYWRASCADRTTKAALCSLASALSDHMPYGQSYFQNVSSQTAAREAIDRFFNRYAENGMFIAVDEAQYLPVDVLKEIGDYPELYNVPVVFSGNDKLLKRTRAEMVDLTQILRRCPRQFSIGVGTDDDHNKIAEAYGVIGGKALRACRLYGEKLSIGELVAMLRMAKNAAQKKGESSIGEDEIESSIFFLTRNRNVLKP